MKKMLTALGFLLVVQNAVASKLPNCVFSFIIPSQVGDSQVFTEDEVARFYLNSDKVTGIRVYGKDVILHLENDAKTIHTPNMQGAVKFSKALAESWRECRDMEQKEFNEAFVLKSKIH